MVSAVCVILLQRRLADGVTASPGELLKKWGPHVTQEQVEEGLEIFCRAVLAETD